MPLILAESPADVPAREALLDRAMGPGRKRKSSEKLRRGRKPSEGLALFARDANGAVVGTVRLWDVAAGDDGRAALLLGPLAVDPTVKSAGIGSALMRHALEEARAAGPSRHPAGRRCALLSALRLFGGEDRRPGHAGSV